MAQEELCVIKSRDFVVVVDLMEHEYPIYRAGFAYTSQLEYIDYEQYSLVAVVPWNLDAHLYFLGKAVKVKIQQILSQTFKAVMQVTASVHKPTDVKTFVKKVSKALVKKLRRYYNGSFVTKLFCEELNKVVSSIAKFMMAFVQSQKKLAPKMIVAELVC